MRRTTGPALIALALLAQGCADSDTDPNAQAAAPQETTVTPQVANLFTLGQEARQAKSNEDWESARAIYLEALGVAPRHPVIYERIAEVEVRLGSRRLGE